MKEISSTIEARSTKEAQVWAESRYYDDAEQWTWLFWSEKHQFLPLFKLLDTDNVIELACGHGRHSEQLLEHDEQVETCTLVDVLQSNIDFCKNRLKNRAQCRFIKNSGTAFTGVADQSATAIFCYDAMVHFHRSVVFEYLSDMRRVLKPGGRALLHHSNYALDPDDSFADHPHARAFMSAKLFETYVSKADLCLLGQRIIDWGGEKNLDCISLVERSR